MLYSMTGYGRTVQEFSDCTVIVEIRSLNSKFADIKIKLPQAYREKELEIRKIISDVSHRGKIDLLVEVQNHDGGEDFTLNRHLFKQYYKELTNLCEEVGLVTTDLLPSILRLPSVVASNQDVISEEKWKEVESVLLATLEKLMTFRCDEGEVLKKDFSERIAQITDLLQSLEPFEQGRIEKIKERLRQSLEENLVKDAIDNNRFEQELIFYLEKLDITEEKVRLAQHCKYFLTEMNNNKNSKGKKLGFICQEIGREINTIGSKANSSDIQRIVVQMKDELERIKEQLANIL